MDILFFILFICSHHVRCSLIMTPKNGIDSTLVIIWLFSFKSVLKWQFLLFDLNIIKCFILFRFSPSIKTLISSANNIWKILSDILTISLTCDRNGGGPKIHPCRTPHKTVLAAETLSLKETPTIPYLSSLFYNIWWFTVSKALPKSRNKPIKYLPLSIVLIILYTNTDNAIDVEFFSGSQIGTSAKHRAYSKNL